MAVRASSGWFGFLEFAARGFSGTVLMCVRAAAV